MYRNAAKRTTESALILESECMTESTIIYLGSAMFDRSIKIISSTSQHTCTVKRTPFDIPADFAADLIVNDPYFVECAVCEKTHAAIQMTFLMSSGEFVCDDCIADNVTICEECGTLCLFNDTHKMYHAIIDTQTNKSGFICHSCKNTFYDACEQCGKIVRKTRRYLRNADHRTFQLCTECRDAFDASHAVCSECGDYFKISDMKDGKCIECLIQTSQRNEKKSIARYGHTHGTVFFSTQDAPGVYGVEVETTYGNECDALLKELAEFQEICLKRDGSINIRERDGTLKQGIEIVSYPMSLGYHKQYCKWDKMFKILEKYGYKSHDTSCCGYHVHMSRLSFGDTKRKQSRNIAYLLYLFETYKAQIKKFSRRVDFRYCDFYNINYSGITVTRAYQKAVNYNHHIRNMALNFKNEHTVECRVFRGTLNHQTFIAAIELLDHLISVCNSCNDENALRALSWNQITGSIPADKVALKAYLKKQKLME